MTPFLGICTEGVPDDESFECMGERPSISSPEVSGGSTTMDGTDNGEGEGDTGELSSDGVASGGCVQSRTRPYEPICISNLLMLLYALTGFMVCKRVLREESVQSS